MSGLSGDAFVKALQSGNVTLVVGRAQEHVVVSKTILSLKCEFLAKFLEKGGPEIPLEDESMTAVKLFVCWCYQERLPKLNADTTLVDRKDWKNTLIDLWIFAARYDIPKLQNETMLSLIKTLSTPHLLTEVDIKYIWQRTPLPLSGALRGLVSLVIVAQIEDGKGQAKKSIEDFEGVAGLEGMMTKVYTALGEWLIFDPPKVRKKDPRTKWQLFMQDEHVRKALMVEETARSVKKPVANGASAGGKGFRGFAQGEVIELD